ncbi:hypothetical protein [Marivita sp. XM-24bin2]|uniref:hypothetical protein n=1 Tax=Marivita sp. XM-24bin2 TaxID=2133951 RepID=UPI000D7ADDD7|nr:hypothetical protein [Marivita sp. XM-24bin2]PWL32732.1 MAG: hypothetical protein DCO97_21100 [Marivita sp. XM-24bin2]
MGNTPADKNIAAAKERLINVKPGEPGFVRPRVPSDPDFAAFLTSRGFYPLFSADTKQRLLKHLRHLDSRRDTVAEVDALERQAAFAQYSYVHRAKNLSNVAKREGLAHDFWEKAEGFRTALDKLFFYHLIDDPNDVEAPLPDGSGVHILRHSLRDLQAAVEDVELQVAAALSPDQWEEDRQEDEVDQQDKNKPKNTKNLAHSLFIDTCVRVWLRNGGTTTLTYQAKVAKQDGRGPVENFETGLWPFVRDATEDVFNTNAMSEMSRGALSKHLDRRMKRILRSPAAEGEWREDPTMNEWGAPMRGDRPGAAKASLEDAVARSALRMVLNTLKKRWSKMTGHRAD